jgi:hypothetical protein
VGLWDRIDSKRDGDLWMLYGKFSTIWSTSSAYGISDDYDGRSASIFTLKCRILNTIFFDTLFIVPLSDSRSLP